MRLASLGASLPAVVLRIVGSMAKLSNYFNVQFESVKDEVRRQVAHVQGLHSAELVEIDRHGADRVAELGEQIASLEGRIDELTATVAELRATNDQLLAVAAKLAEAPVSPS